MLNFSQDKLSKGFQWFILIVIFLSGFGIRIYDLKDPPLDFHSTRQLRSYLIARSVFYNNNPAFPEEVQKQAAALGDLEVYEPPILEQIVGTTYKIVGEELFWIARIHLAFYWVLGGLGIFLIGKRFFSISSVLVGLAFYFFLPFSVISSRSFQPDPWMTMWIIWTAYALVRWRETPGWKWALVAGVLGGMAILVKVVAAGFILGMMACAFMAESGIRRIFKSPIPYAAIGIAVLPTFIFYLAFHPQRSGDFLSFWTVALSGLLFTTRFYADWMAMLKGLMGLNLFLLGVLGMAIADRTLKPILIGAWFGYVIYGLVFPYQYITHEYYHVPLIPLVALSILPVAQAFFGQFQKQGWFWRWFCIAVLAFGSFYSLYVSRSILFAANYANEPASWRRVGEAIPEGHSFISLSPDYGMRLRYYGWRVMSAAWPTMGDQALYALRGDSGIDYQNYFQEATAGKDFFLVTSLVDFDAQPELKEILFENYPLYLEGNGYLVFDLREIIGDP